MPRAKPIEEPGTISADVPVCAELLIEIQGDNFAYAAQAIGANSHLALIRTSAPLFLGTFVTIHLPETGRSATGRIISETRELSHFEVEFMDPSLLWDKADEQRSARGQSSPATRESYRSWKWY